MNSTVPSIPLVRGHGWPALRMRTNLGSSSTMITGGIPADRLTFITYPDARHRFYMKGFQGRPVQPGAPVYNTEEAQASWATVLDFLKRKWAGEGGRSLNA